MFISDIKNHTFLVSCDEKTPAGIFARMDYAASVCAVLVAAVSPPVETVADVSLILHFLPPLLSVEEDRVYVKSIVLLTLYIPVAVWTPKRKPLLAIPYVVADVVYIGWFIGQTGTLSVAAILHVGISLVVFVQSYPAILATWRVL